MGPRWLSEPGHCLRVMCGMALLSPQTDSSPARLTEGGGGSTAIDWEIRWCAFNGGADLD